MKFAPDGGALCNNLTEGNREVDLSKREALWGKGPVINLHYHAIALPKASQVGV